MVDYPRTGGPSPFWRAFKRNARLTALLLFIVLGVGLLPVVFLYVFQPEAERFSPSSESSPRLSLLEEEVRFESDGLQLAGTLVLPSGSGPHPALVVVHGSGRQSRERHERVARFMAPRGFAVLIYDKRGVGRSGGAYQGVRPDNSVKVLNELASDALAALAVLLSRAEIDRESLGLIGFSQAGWILPIAASRSQDVRFTVTVSGPTVSVGEEIYYSQLTGHDAGRPSHRSQEDVAALLGRFDGPRGFDPVPSLLAMTQPGLWIFGGRDRSIPVPESIAILEEMSRERGKDFSYQRFEEADHAIRDAGSGQPVDFLSAVIDWLRVRVNASSHKPLR